MYAIHRIGLQAECCDAWKPGDKQTSNPGEVTCGLCLALARALELEHAGIPKVPRARPLRGIWYGSCSWCTPPREVAIRLPAECVGAQLDHLPDGSHRVRVDMRVPAGPMRLDRPAPALAPMPLELLPACRMCGASMLEGCRCLQS